jgi:acetoin utilization deacetylase AcuC-like enzyme
MKIFYTDIFPIPLPEHHSFPKDKYAQLRMRILDELDDQTVELRVPEPATDEDILRAHDPDYIRRFLNGELSAKEIRRVGLPWSAEIVQRTRYSVGGTIAASRTALEDGVAVNLGGGTHHAFRDHGQGYCWLNDIVIAARAVQAAGLVRQVLIIDCDVHQGNGTAATLKDDASIFTFSIHGKNNFPYRKEKSDLDVELPDGAQDADYLAALDEGIMRSIKNFSAELVIYLAGADPYREDRFGRLALTKEGLAQRDRLVLRFCDKANLPAAVTMAGGYARNLEDIVDINFQTILSALEFAK